MLMSPNEWYASQRKSHVQDRTAIVNMGPRKKPVPAQTLRPGVVATRPTYSNAGNAIGAPRRGKCSLPHHANKMLVSCPKTTLGACPGNCRGCAPSWTPSMPMAINERHAENKEPHLPTVSAGIAGKLGHLQMYFIDSPGVIQPGVDRARAGITPFTGKPFTVIPMDRKNHIQTVDVIRPAYRTQSVEGLGEVTGTAISQAEIALGHTPGALQRAKKEYALLEAKNDEIQRRISAEKDKSWFRRDGTLITNLARDLSNNQFAMGGLQSLIIKPLDAKAAEINTKRQVVKLEAVKKDLHEMRESIGASVAFQQEIRQVERGIDVAKKKASEQLYSFSKNKKLIMWGAAGLVGLTVLNSLGLLRRK